MRNLLNILLVGFGASALALAQTQAPEIDPSSGICAMTLLAGALLLVRSKIKR